MSESTYTDSKVIELSKSFVNLVAHQETTHGTHEAVVGREKAKLCNEYYDIPCDVHTKATSAIGKFFNGTFGTPTTVFCDPSGKELSRLVGGASSSELMKKMNESLGKVSGDHVALGLWHQAHQFVSEAEAAAQKSDYHKAVEAYSRIAKMSKGAWFKDTSKEGLDKMNQAGEERLKEALALEAVEEKKKALRKVADDFKPLPCSLEAKKELDALK
jgi:hypothetical protein